ncbi:MAG: LLM class flavin-dependent oxidoreductase [Sporichthyaceae bacterium]
MKGPAMVRFSYLQIPDYPITDSLAAIAAADELGFYACYVADETWHRDGWLLLAAAAGRTENIRLGPNLTHVILRDPAMIAQTVATLDELTGGRAECVVSCGNLGLLQQHGIDGLARRPIPRVREAIAVMRTFLADGAITHHGEFFDYEGLFTCARPVQQPFPIKMGAMAGPYAFEVAGQFADGMHHALGYSKENWEFVTHHLKLGLDKSGRTLDDFDFATVALFVVAADGDAAREVARTLVGFYLSAVPANQIARHGIDRAVVDPILEAVHAGQIDRAIELTTPELVETLSISGTPAECVAKLRADVLPWGVNHVVAGIVDPALVKLYTGKDVDNVPDAAGQLRLIAEHVVPALEAFHA